jgi:hypothetical protein
LGYQAHGGADADGLAVGGGNAGALLAPMLQGEETKKDRAGCVVFWCINSYHPAFFFGMV